MKLDDQTTDDPLWSRDGIRRCIREKRTARGTPLNPYDLERMRDHELEITNELDRRARLWTPTSGT